MLQSYFVSLRPDGPLMQSQTLYQGRQVLRPAAEAAGNQVRVDWSEGRRRHCRMSDRPRFWSWQKYRQL